MDLRISNMDVLVRKKNMNILVMKEKKKKE